MKVVRCHLKVLLAQKEMREDRSISLRKVALETGVREYTVYGFANNTLREYPVEAVAKICEYLGCEVGDLLKLEEIAA
jgi:DNA-binding Xre family transcriptional regulator